MQLVKKVVKVLFAHLFTQIRIPFSFENRNFTECCKIVVRCNHCKRTLCGVVKMGYYPFMHNGFALHSLICLRNILRALFPVNHLSAKEMLNPGKNCDACKGTCGVWDCPSRENKPGFLQLWRQCCSLPPAYFGMRLWVVLGTTGI